MDDKTRVLDALTRKAKSKTELSRSLDMPRKRLGAMLDALVGEGLAQEKGKGYALRSRETGFEGRVLMHERGFAFIRRQDGPDVFVGRSNTGGAMHGDTVIFEMRGESEGAIRRVTERAVKEVVGTVKGRKLYPDDRRLPVMELSGKGASEGIKAVAEILHYPGNAHQLIGRVVEKLGFPGEKDVDVLSLIREHGIRTAFPKPALDQAGGVKRYVSAGEIERREDLRYLNAFTVDGASAKDFDDAVSLEPLPAGVRLGVHIADVSHYVKRGSPIDVEAYERGTSVYLPGLTLPMLPEALSNGICSLNPNEDRLTLSVLMDVSTDGEVTAMRVVRAAIQSRARLTYEEVNEWFDRGGEPTPAMRPLLPELEMMMALARTLSAKRLGRGALNLEMDEAEIVLDDEGAPLDIFAAERGSSNRMIEEFMLLCNEQVARWCLKGGVPCMYRVHETPDGGRMEAFAHFAAALGYKLTDPAAATPAALSALLEQARGKDEYGALARVMLRSMAKARYDGRPLGHYGLALKDYCHFTSPIRRYPDLIVHRMVKARLKGEESRGGIAESMAELAGYLSACERATDETERDVDDLKKAQYMTRFIGEEFDGVIEGMNPSGFFVGLPSTVEGFVRAADLDDRYNYDEALFRLIGERSGRIFRLGDRVRIRVAAVYLATRKVDFELLE